MQRGGYFLGGAQIESLDFKDQDSLESPHTYIQYREHLTYIELQ